MNPLSTNTTRKRIYFQAGLWTFLTWLITAVHHFYTGVLYHTMWRAWFAAYAIIPMVICITLLYFGFKKERKFYVVSYLILSFIFFFIVVGLWEGAWCHTTKLLLYSFGIPFHNAPASWNVPPAPTPTDVFSEVTGVLNFIFASINLGYNFALKKVAFHN
jgi:hypothetical protein